MNQQLILTIPVEIEMSDLSASDEGQFVRQAMNRCPIQIGREPLMANTTWFTQRWRSQVALQQALRDSPPDLLQFLGTVALQDLASPVGELQVKSLTDTLFPTIKRLELENEFFPLGMDADAALVETALELLNSVQVNFGVPSISAEGGANFDPNWRMIPTEPGHRFRVNLDSPKS